jgi:hypothetical protein
MTPGGGHITRGKGLDSARRLACVEELDEFGELSVNTPRKPFSGIRKKVTCLWSLRKLGKDAKGMEACLGRLVSACEGKKIFSPWRQEACMRIASLLGVEHSFGRDQLAGRGG